MPLLDPNSTGVVANKRIDTSKDDKKDGKITFNLSKEEDKSKLIEEKTTIVNIAKQAEKEAKEQNDNYTLNYKKNNELDQSKATQLGRKQTKDQVDVNDSNRSNLEIMLLMAEFAKRTNKTSIADIFKLFDKDGNSFINKREVLTGFNNIGIPLSKLELDRIWVEMYEGQSGDKVVLSGFKKFFEKYEIIKKR